MNIGDVYARVCELSVKEGNGGYSDPVRFNLDIKQAEMQFFSIYYNNPKQYSRDNKAPIFGYADSMRVVDNLVPYMASTPLYPAKGLYLGKEVGISDIPSDYKHPTGFFCSYSSVSTKKIPSLDCGDEQTVPTKEEDIVEVKILVQDTFGFRMGSTIKPPAPDYPIAMFMGGKIITAPYGIGPLRLDYLRDPKGAIFNYTLDGNRVIYNPVGSRDFEAPTDCHEEIINIILSYMGIRTGQEGLPGYADRKLQQGT